MKIGAVIITYNPDIDLFKQCVNSLENQIDEVIIVDNGSDSAREISNIISGKNNFILINFVKNMGIAYATNVGIKFLLEKEFDYVLTSDQDTIFPLNYISCFNSALSELSNYSNIAAFIPVIYDTVTNKYKPCYITGKLFYQKKIPNDKYTKVFQAVASGMIINLNIYNNLGGMNENLFIDMVDFEWCWKVNYNHYDLVCCKQLIINHHLGDCTKKIINKDINIRSNIRYYYLIRNSFFLALYTCYISIPYKIVLFFLSFKYIIGYPLISEKPILTLKYCLRGMVDGICKKTGKFK